MKKKIFVAASIVGAIAFVALESRADKVCRKVTQKRGIPLLSRTVIPSDTQCPKGTTEIVDSSTLTGPTGPQGPQGAKGDTGPGGGSITGQLRTFGSTCAAAGPGSYVRIPGTSYEANADTDGYFKIFNVKAGSYSLAFGNGLTETSSVTVTDGATTDVGTLLEHPTCCGNDALDAGEVCETLLSYVVDANGNHITNGGSHCIGLGFSGGRARCYTCNEITYECFTS